MRLLQLSVSLIFQFVLNERSIKVLPDNLQNFRKVPIANSKMKGPLQQKLIVVLQPVKQKKSGPFEPDLLKRRDPDIYRDVIN
jgi:hypothetical protein